MLDLITLGLWTASLAWVIFFRIGRLLYYYKTVVEDEGLSIWHKLPMVLFLTDPNFRQLAITTLTDTFLSVWCASFFAALIPARIGGAIGALSGLMLSALITNIFRR